MELSWQVNLDKPKTVRDFLKGQGVSRKLMAVVKDPDRSQIYFNGQSVYHYEPLAQEGHLSLHLPVESPHPYIQPLAGNLDILFEDDHLLVINKPARLLSTPSFNDPQESVANRVLHYYQDQGYEDQVIHLVTRLDRNTSGALVFAKHRYAHALMDQILRQQKMDKLYLAGVSSPSDRLGRHGYFDDPIGRSPRSIIERQVDAEGKPALTEYWHLARNDQGDLYRVKLHTGRTHQIRVHFSHAGYPLLGDSLYGGKMTERFTRQALHCEQVHFIHPITQQQLILKADLPEDLSG